MSVSAAEFLDAVYANATPGRYVTISGYRLNGDSSYKTDDDGAPIWTDKVAVAAVDELDSLTVEPLDRWFTVHPRIEPKRGSGANTAEVLALPIDFDFADSSDGKDPARSFTSVDGVRRFCNQLLPIPPSALVESGHGVHAYWFLTDPVGPQEGKQLLANFDAYVSAQAATIGKDLDAVRDLARVLRLPDSMNLKDPDNPRPVTVAELHQGRRYSVEDFGFCPDVPVSGINPDTSKITDEAVTEWIEALPAGKVDEDRISHYVDTMRVAVPCHDKKGRRPTGMMVLGWLTVDAEVGRVDFRAAVGAVGDEFVAMFTNKDAARTEFAKMTVRTIKYRIAEPIKVADLLIGGTQPVEPAVTVAKGLEDVEPVLSSGPLNAYRADDLRTWADVEVEFRIPGVIAKGSFGVFGGPKKSLKSSLTSGDLAISLANRVPWLNSPELKPTAAVPVLVIINEGLKPYLRTLFRLAEAKGLSGIGDITVVPAVGVRLDNDDLAKLIRSVAADRDDLVIIYDATYGFVGGDTQAENLFAMNDVLSVAQATGTEVGADVWLVHHYKKNTKGRPDLDDLSWSGFGEWVDSWMLFTHREKPRADEGLFSLGMVAGSRNGFESLYEIDANLGVLGFDGTFDQLPTFTATKVSQADSEQWGKNGRSEERGMVETLVAITDRISDEPHSLTKTEIVKGLSSKHRVEAWETHVANGVIAPNEIEYVNKLGHRRTRVVWDLAVRT